MYDEAESAASFQEALQEWRKSETAKPAKHSECQRSCILMLYIS